MDLLPARLSGMLLTVPGFAALQAQETPSQMINRFDLRQADKAK